VGIDNHGQLALERLLLADGSHRCVTTSINLISRGPMLAPHSSTKIYRFESVGDSPALAMHLFGSSHSGHHTASDRLALHRLRCSLASPIPVRAGPVASDELGLRMSPQPIRRARRFSIGQKIDGFAAFEIDQDRAVGHSLATCPIAHAQHPHLAGARKGHASDPPQQRVAAGKQPKFFGEPGSRRAAQGKPDERQRSL
jgi:hypothetical protein